MATDDEKKKDFQTLINLLTVVEEQLKIVVHERKDLFRKEFLEYLPGPWTEVERHFAQARQQIENGNLEWEYVEGVGLTGNALLWKEKILRESVRQKIVGRILKLANGFLGSLLKGVPMAEFIKEYKDFVEGCMKLESGRRL
jgi:hypothetical protein